MQEVVLPVTYTEAEATLRTSAQRRINMVWEYSQAAIALLVVLANIGYAFVQLFLQSLSGSDMLANAFFLVIGFYFGRTNHARIGEDRNLDTR